MRKDEWDMGLSRDEDDEKKVPEEEAPEVPTKPVIIVTIGGPEKGKSCAFPFTWEGKPYTDSCVKDISGIWCPTGDDKGRQWGSCPDTSPAETPALAETPAPAKTPAPVTRAVTTTALTTTATTFGPTIRSRACDMLETRKDLKGRKVLESHEIVESETCSQCWGWCAKTNGCTSVIISATGAKKWCHTLKNGAHENNATHENTHSCG